MKLRASLLLIVPVVIWLAGVTLRPHTLEPYCVKSEPSLCTENALFSLDRIGAGLERPDADAWSNWGQSIGIIAAAGVPLVFHASRAVALRLTPTGALIALGQDLWVITQTIAWNGALTEMTRLIVGRPRPFVYLEPQSRGTNPAHYVSFYSGHTSFVATVMMALLLMLSYRGAAFGWLISTGIAMHSVVMITAFGRVLSGRHFITDTLVGAAAGFCVALALSALSSRWPRALPLDRKLKSRDPGALR